MNLHFEIIEANDADHTVVARFTTDRVGAEMLDPQRDTETGEVLRRPDGSPTRIRTDYCIGLPPDLVVDPDSQAFRDFILQYAPAQWFAVLEARLDGLLEPASGLLGGTSSLQQQVVREVQLRLDAFARTRGYDGILSACTYATSAVAQFAAEGQRAVDVRDTAWGKCYAILGEVEAGTRAVPTVQDVLAELPAMTWTAS